MSHDFDQIVIGSGFGGAVAALRLAEKGYRVLVLEQGRRFTPETLPKTTWDVKNWLWRPSLGLTGFFGIRFFRHLTVLHGNAVGGGSITYANTLLEPPASVWQSGNWAGLADWLAIMPRHYVTARRMLGVTTNRLFGPADERLRDIARLAGREATFYPTEVAVYFGPEGEPPGTTRGDPYFGGAGPERQSCIGCGGCMLGCRHGAKNSLDRNYLYLAEQLGAEIRAETKVIDIRPLRSADGADGYAVTTVPLKGKGRTRLTAGSVVVAASSLGTQDLLLRQRANGALPALSPRLGEGVRTNAEALIGLRFPGASEDYSQGIAIGSGFYLDAHTHIEATRYGAGSDLMSLSAGPMVDGPPGWRRVLRWLGVMTTLLVRSPRSLWRMLRTTNWARESLILLCMQTLEGQVKMRLKRPWYWPFRRVLASHAPALAPSIPEANALAMRAATALGGVPAATLGETLFNIPMTAHCMGGALMGGDGESGVCDFAGRVFGYRNLVICDGSLISANLGVNPSLTITALAEHVMSQIPPKKARGS